MHHHHRRHQRDEEDRRHPRGRSPQQGRWGAEAPFVQGFPMKVECQHHDFIERPTYLPPLPQQVRGSHRPPGIATVHGRSRPRAVVIPQPVRTVHVPHQVHLPTKHVHFELPHRDRERHRRQHAENERLSARRPNTPANVHQLPHRPSHHNLRRTTPHIHHIPRKPSLRDQGLRQHSSPSPSPHEHRPSPRDRDRIHRSPRQPDPPPRSSRPTVHILTYALKHTPTTTAALRILSDNLPPDTPHLYTIHAHKFTPPPERLCEQYSGVTSVIQEYVMRDARARKAVSRVVEDLLEWWRRERERARREGREGRMDVAVSVCCVLGTHRSVSVAEGIGREIERGKGGRGVRVRIVHVHRERGSREGF
ncbi:hypothetical protein CC80DRAFT_541470 [Byssothecium circinans]|uniref:RapZ C-terminal domain-containing protein n=1 Tax=Byssothecium circinans TaxID=147558 RepID=A0A6A5UIC8_9PLEO|nr:hypothetical protein CC80DRAFT_541470 [Byssothecium circinans]